MLVGVQTGGIIKRFGIESGYKMIKDAGFEAIDWNIDTEMERPSHAYPMVLEGLCIFEKPLEDVLAYFENELSAIRKNGLTISQAHAPFPAYVEGRYDILDYTIKIYRRCIEICDAVGCKYLVIHGISAEPANKTDSAEDIKALNMKLYEGLVDTLKNTNVTVCLENLPVKSKITSTMSELVAGICSNPYDAVEYIDTLNNKAEKICFGFCLDTGHLNLLRMRFADYLPVINNRLSCLHIHDNTGVFDSHKAPYTGTILWDEFVAEMRKLDYAGDLCFETFRQLASVPDELVPTFLKLIADIGYYFKNEISK